uniref:Polyketide synthase n=1 Tax=Peronospora matthiolae TaxID=2874970 RepID=A0AAV1TR38_9STRA
MIQRSVDAAAQAAVTPEVVSVVSLPNTGDAQPGAPDTFHLVTNACLLDPSVATHRPGPKLSPERPCLSQPIRGRGRLWQHGTALPSPATIRIQTGAYDALRDEGDD